jgi:hypothetical protein
MEDCNMTALNPEKLTLENLSLEDARLKAIELLLDLKIKKSKFNNLIRDIKNAKTSREVQRIMWNMYMAGTGYGVGGSDWQKFHRGV